MNKKIIIVLLIISVLISITIFLLKRENQQVIPAIYKITLDVNGRASVLETDEKGMLKEPDEPYMPGGEFLGWYIGDEKVDFSMPFTSNSTIRAKWK